MGNECASTQLHITMYPIRVLFAVSRAELDINRHAKTYLLSAPLSVAIFTASNHASFEIVGLT